MENQLNILERKINDSIKVPFNKIFFSQNEERSFIKYKDNLVTQEEVEVASREVILDLEEKYEVMEHDITFLISYDEVLNHNKVLFKSLMVETDNSDENKIKIPAGTYLTMYYDDSTLDNRKYYNKMINFIHKNNL